jgi:hypothetical protein
MGNGQREDKPVSLFRSLSRPETKKVELQESAQRVSDNPEESPSQRAIRKIRADFARRVSAAS